MTKYNKTSLTLTALHQAHATAIDMYTRAYKAGDTAGRTRWHIECSRLEAIIHERETDKVLADAQNELMRTTDMKRQEELDASAAECWEQNYDKDCPALDEVPDPVEPLYVEDLWFKDGVAYGRTPGCGCCSEIMSSEDDDYDFSPGMRDLDRMAAYVEQQEAKVQALREDFNEYCNSQENG